MTAFKPIHSAQTPQAIGCYSQAVIAEPFIFLSGQIGIDPTTGEMVVGIKAQLQQVFTNLQQVLKAASADLSHIVKLNVYLTDLSHFALVNETMQEFFQEPYPARAAIEVSGLPKGALVEVDGIARII